MPSIQIGDESGFVERFPLDIALNLPPAMANDVAIGRVARVAFGIVDGTDVVVAKLKFRRDVKREFLTDFHIGQSDGSGRGTDQMGVAELHRARESGDSGVQIGNARTVDARRVTEFQRLRRIDLVFHTGLRHPVAQMFAEIVGTSIGKTTFQMAVFVAKSCPGRPFFLAPKIVGVGGGDLRAVVEGPAYCGRRRC